MRMKITILLICLVTSFSISAYEEGYASWYGGKFQGRMTANGEIFDTYKLTAAHKTLPFGTIIKVTNLSNSLSVLVRVNDRGPFVAGRIVDLSKAAADAIKMTGAGIARVKLEVAETPPKTAEGSADTVYIIQVASYSVQENAVQTADILAANGFKTGFEKLRNGITRVLLHDIDPAELNNVLRKLADIGFPEVLVKK